MWHSTIRNIKNDHYYFCIALVEDITPLGEYFYDIKINNASQLLQLLFSSSWNLTKEYSNVYYKYVTNWVD